MSVDVMVDALSTGEFTATCYGSDQRTEIGPFSGIDAAREAIAAHKQVCAECDCYGMYPNAVMDVDVFVNMSNTNAAMMLGIIGIDTSEDLCGSMSGEQFLGRVLTALAQDRDDSAVADVVDAAPGQATFIACGLPAGYVTERLLALEEIARTAYSLGRDVTWG